MVFIIISFSKQRHQCTRLIDLEEGFKDKFKTKIFVPYFLVNSALTIALVKGPLINAVVVKGSDYYLTGNHVSMMLQLPFQKWGKEILRNLNIKIFQI